jgi:predicted nucleic acid-binding protein
MAKIILDSSVLIALLNPMDMHHRSAVKATSARHEYSISAVTMSEALIEPFKRSKQHGIKISETIKKIVKKVIVLDQEIAERAAFERATKNLSLPDALICATADVSNQQLWTFDEKLVKLSSKAVRVITE